VHSNIGVVPWEGRLVSGAHLEMGRPVCSLRGEFADIFPSGGVERGAVTALYGRAGVYTVLSEVLAGTTAKGANVVCVNVSGLGAQLLRDVGADLSRVVRVDVEAPKQLSVLTALIDSFDMVVFPFTEVGSKWRAVVSRVRERSTAMLIVGRGRPASLERVRGAGGLSLEVEVQGISWRCDPGRTGSLVVREGVRVTCLRHGYAITHEVGHG